MSSSTWRHQSRKDFVSMLQAGLTCGLAQIHKCRTARGCWSRSRTLSGLVVPYVGVAIVSGHISIHTTCAGSCCARKAVDSCISGSDTTGTSGACIAEIPWLSWTLSATVLAAFEDCPILMTGMMNMSRTMSLFIHWMRFSKK